MRALGILISSLRDRIHFAAFRAEVKGQRRKNDKKEKILRVSPSSWTPQRKSTRPPTSTSHAASGFSSLVSPFHPAELAKVARENEEAKLPPSKLCVAEIIRRLDTEGRRTFWPKSPPNHNGFLALGTKVTHLYGLFINGAQGRTESRYFLAGSVQVFRRRLLH